VVKALPEHHLLGSLRLFQQPEFLKKYIGTELNSSIADRGDFDSDPARSILLRAVGSSVDSQAIHGYGDGIAERKSARVQATCRTPVPSTEAKRLDPRSASSILEQLPLGFLTMHAKIWPKGDWPGNIDTSKAEMVGFFFL